MIKSKSRVLKVTHSTKKAPELVTRKTSKVTTHRAPKVLGETSDGVRILKPKTGATHFTATELEAAISRVRAARLE
jgi:hypothetical protein